MEHNVCENSSREHVDSGKTREPPKRFELPFTVHNYRPLTTQPPEFLNETHGGLFIFPAALFHFSFRENFCAKFWFKSKLIWWIEYDWWWNLHWSSFSSSSITVALWTRVGPKRPQFSISMGSITLPKVFPCLQLFQERPHTGRVALGLCQKISDHDHLRSDHDHLSREADRSRYFARGNKWSAKVRASFHNPNEDHLFTTVMKGS